MRVSFPSSSKSECSSRVHSTACGYNQHKHSKCHTSLLACHRRWTARPAAISDSRLKCDGRSISLLSTMGDTPYRETDMKLHQITDGRVFIQALDEVQLKARHTTMPARLLTTKPTIRRRSRIIFCLQDFVRRTCYFFG